MIYFKIIWRPRGASEWIHIPEDKDLVGLVANRDGDSTGNILYLFSHEFLSTHRGAFMLRWEEDIPEEEEDDS